jgi:hypothetical protein
MNCAMKSQYCVYAILALCLCLGACDRIGDRLGLEDPARKAARADAEGKAVGGGCRQSGRAIEDCYAVYTWLPMESIYAGWREMDEYMRENGLETVRPKLPPPANPNVKKKKAAGNENPPETEAEAGEAPPDAPAPAPSPPAGPGPAGPEPTGAGGSNA